jgi:hypothetical protein
MMRASEEAKKPFFSLVRVVGKMTIFVCFPISILSAFSMVSTWGRLNEGGINWLREQERLFRI